MAVTLKKGRKKIAKKLAKKDALKRKRLKKNEGVDSNNQHFMEDLSHCFRGFGMIHEYTAMHLYMSLRITQTRKEQEGFVFVNEQKGVVLYMKKGDVRIAVVHSNIVLYDSWVISHSSQFSKLKQRFSSSEAFEFIVGSHVEGEESAKYRHVRTGVVVKIVSRKRPIFSGIRSR